MAKDENGYYIDEACMAKWKDEPPEFGIGFRVIREHREGKYRIIDEFELLEVSISEQANV